MSTLTPRDSQLLKSLTPATNLILSQDDKYPAVENCVINAALLCNLPPPLSLSGLSVDKTVHRQLIFMVYLTYGHNR